MSTNFKTPAGAVRGLGSARAGTEHHIRQRVSAIALIFLVLEVFLGGRLGSAGASSSS